MLTNGIVPDQLGGLQRYVRELSGALVAAGAEVTVLTRRLRPEDPPTEIGDDGVLVRRHHVPSTSNLLYALLYPASAGLAAGSVLRGTGGDTVVHVHFAMNGIAPALMRRPYVQTFHAPAYRELLPEHHGRYPLSATLAPVAVAAFRTLEALVCRRAREHVVLSEFMRGELTQLAGRGRAERAVRIPGGLDTAWFTPGPGVSDSFAAAARPLLFTARRLVPRTGVGELVRAMPQIVARFPGARLAVAGDGPLRDRLLAQIDELCLHDCVRLLGRVDEGALRGWYRAADLFVLPTQELEGFGLATAEALACGTPALGTPIGATPEILAQLDPGLVSPGTSCDDLAAAIVALLERPAALADIGRRARPCVHPGFGWPAVAQRYLQLYDELSPPAANAGLWGAASSWR
jgi:glycosyltransferase involved in cell wall biosynthesis